MNPKEAVPAPVMCCASAACRNEVVDDHELQARSEEARAQAELAARQAAEVQAKQERSSKRKVVAPPPVEPATGSGSP
jgi:tellurite resistance protein